MSLSGALANKLYTSVWREGPTGALDDPLFSKPSDTHWRLPKHAAGHVSPEGDLWDRGGTGRVCPASAISRVPSRAIGIRAGRLCAVGSSRLSGVAGITLTR